MKRYYRISFCTVSMNRMHHIMQTLPANIQDNEDYPELEFVLLDYNSSDELDKYVHESLYEHIENGKLKYYKTFGPQYFHRSHSRNLLFKLASGDLVCNIDADNFTGSGFASYINEEFNKDQNIFLTTLKQNVSKFTRDVYGRLCLKKNDFYKVGGFDEQMANYGFEDYDLANRLEMAGVKRSTFNFAEHLKAINHKQSERLSNEYVSLKLESILIRYITPSMTDFVFLFKNGDFKKGVLIDNPYHVYDQPLSKTRAVEFAMKQQYSILEDQWVEGKWNKEELSIQLDQPGRAIETLVYYAHRNCYSSKSGDYYTLTEKTMVSRAIMLFSQLTNRAILTSNLVENRQRVNQEGFGKETVFKNFNLSIPIQIN
jgi:hypothetical protein